MLLDNRYPNFVTPICKAAQARGIPRVLDLDKAAPLDDPLLHACSHVISSAEALRGTTGLNDLGAALKKLGQSFKGFLAFTDGSDGVYWLEDGEIRHMDAFKVKAIDTLGAGDVFHGAFTFRFVESGDVRDAMRFAGAAAAIKCTRFGGLMGAATRRRGRRFPQAKSGVNSTSSTDRERRKARMRLQNPPATPRARSTGWRGDRSGLLRRRAARQ